MRPVSTQVSLFDRPTNTTVLNTTRTRQKVGRSEVGPSQNPRGSCKCTSCETVGRCSTNRTRKLHVKCFKRRCFKPKTQFEIVRRVLHPVQVKAHKFDIRSLNPCDDGVGIFGRHHHKELPIRVDYKGRLEVVTKGAIPSTVFQEQFFTQIQVPVVFLSLPLQDTSNKTVYSYAVINQGVNSVEVKLDISPNGRDFIFDSLHSCPPQQAIAIVANRFLRYTRISARTIVDQRIAILTGQQTSTIDVYFQSQTIG